MKHDDGTGLKLVLDFEYGKAVRLIHTVKQLVDTYGYSLQHMHKYPVPMHGLYYVGSKDNNPYVEVMLDLLQQLSPYMDDSRVIAKIKEAGLRFIQTDKAIPTGSIAKALSTHFGVFWYEGTPGAGAIQKDVYWTVC
jgi:hypothetical protein